MFKRKFYSWLLLAKLKIEKMLQLKHQLKLVFDLPTKKVLTDIPRKKYKLNSINYRIFIDSCKLSYTEFNKILIDVLKLHHVASKHFLTSKVDRSVTGLIAQQQCLGPPHTIAIADNFIIADSYFNKTGVVSSIGEQPIKGLYDPKIGVGMVR